jgi:hypothetical protein
MSLLRFLPRRRIVAETRYIEPRIMNSRNRFTKYVLVVLVIITARGRLSNIDIWRGKLHIRYYKWKAYKLPIVVFGWNPVSPPRLMAENTHCTLDTLDYILTHVRGILKQEPGNPIPSGCATREEVRKGAPITPQNGPSNLDVVQAAEKILECVRPTNLRLYEPRGQVHINEAKIGEVAHLGA